MKFEWDTKKASANIKKHEVSFEVAVTVFSDPFHLSILDSTSDKEERWITIGFAANHKTLVVVHTYLLLINNEEHIQIISARKATKQEKKEYEERI